MAVGVIQKKAAIEAGISTECRRNTRTESFSVLLFLFAGDGFFFFCRGSPIGLLCRGLLFRFRLLRSGDSLGLLLRLIDSLRPRLRLGLRTGCLLALGLGLCLRPALVSNGLPIHVAARCGCG